MEQAQIFKARIQRSTPVAIYGLQRSGTNYLLQALLALNMNVINKIEPNRGNPRNKHFRWQEDKATIPSPILAQYGNAIHADSLIDLCTATHRPQDCRHIVIFKHKDPWLASVLNWGLKCRWFPSKAEALSFAEAFGADYDAYLSQWNKYATDEPRKVAIVQHEAIMEDFELLKNAARFIGVKLKKNGFNGKLDEVPMSPKNRRRPITVYDIRMIRTQFGS